MTLVMNSTINTKINAGRHQIVVKKTEQALRQKLLEHGEVTVFVSHLEGVDEILEALSEISKSAPKLMSRFRLLVAGSTGNEDEKLMLSSQANSLGIHFQILNSNLSSLKSGALSFEYSSIDIVHFVNATSTMNKMDLVETLKWLSKHMAWDGILVTDCITPEAQKIIGDYRKSKLSYYTTEVFCQIMDYCGFNGEAAYIADIGDQINKVVITCPRLYPLETPDLSIPSCVGILSLG